MKVLIVELNEALRRAVKRLVQKHSSEPVVIIEVTGLDDLKESWGNLHDGLDFVFTSCRMSEEREGFRVAEFIRMNAGQEVKMVLMSGVTSNFNDPKYAALFDNYLEKPIDFNKMRKLLTVKG